MAKTWLYWHKHDLAEVRAAKGRVVGKNALGWVIKGIDEVLAKEIGLIEIVRLKQKGQGLCVQQL